MLYCLQAVAPAILLELLNESQDVVFASTYNKDTVVIASGKSALLDPGRQLVLRRGEATFVFDLKRVPSRHVHTTERGFVVYAIFDDSSALYLATKTDQHQIVRVDPQPPGFPLKVGTH